MAEIPIHLQQDPYADKLLAGRFDWRDERVLALINQFVKSGTVDSKGNIKRQNAINTGALLKSIEWRTWNDCGGNRQVFEAKYNYYAKFVELAVGKGAKYTPLPAIAQKKWAPIPRPDGKKRKAKPSIPTELRKQARKFVTLVEQRFSYAGIAMMIYAMGNNKENAAAINRLMFARRR